MTHSAHTRGERLAAIKSLIEGESVGSQERLVELLSAQGFVVTQSSVSRDLRDLQVGKMRGRYVITSVAAGGVTGILSASTAGPNLIVLRTSIGAANLVAVHIDQAAIDGIAGTIAGDDTIFIAVESEAVQATVLAKLGVRSHG